MAWITLVVSGVLETVWVAALSQSRGFTRLVPSVVFGVALVLSMIGLAHALRTIPVGTGRRLVRHGLAGPLIAYRR
jgi:quaternary ammonium compound-resistance protein SugE